MNFQGLRFFVEVCDNESILKAAEKCYISRQGISSSIMKLEDELGTSLLVRTRSGVRPTETGKILYEYALKALSLNDKCLQDIARMDGYENTVKVMFSPGSIRAFAAPAIVDLNKSGGVRSLCIIEKPDLVCESAVERSLIEAALVPGPLNTDRFDTFFLTSIPYAAAVSRKNPLSQKSELCLSELLDSTLLILDESYKINHNFMSALNAAELKPKKVIEVSDPTTGLYFAQLNNGIYITTTSFCRDNPNDNYAAVPLRGTALSYDLFLITQKNTKLSRSTVQLKELLLKYSTTHGEAI